MFNGWIGNYSYFRARIHANSIAVVDVDRGARYTYGDLNDRANRLANFLRDQFSVIKGDRVAVLSRNRVEMIDAYYATGKLGAILVPYNARLSVKELGQLVRNETPKVLILEDIYADTIASLREDLKEDGLLDHLIVLRDDPSKQECYPCYDLLLKDALNTPVSCDELTLEDTHLIIHTGGTTGLPKGGLLSHRCMIFNSFNEICTWGINYDDRALLVLPLFHTGGWNLLTLPLLHVGGRLYLSRQYDPQKTIELIEKEKITFLFGAATIFRMMVEQSEFASTDFSSLKWAMAGAAPTPVNIMKAFWDKGVKCILGYGMTEAGPNNLSVPAQFLDQALIEEKYASVGKPMYLTLVKIVDNDGNEILTPNTPGELLWSGPQIFSGYWNNQKETEKTLIDGWVQTGDMATFDDDGFYYIVGRKKNMFISGGENIFPPEIETALYDIEAVRECCVFGVPDEKWGEVGKAVLSLKSGHALTKDGVLSALNGKLAKYKIPKYVTFMEDIPKNNVGKIVIAEVVKIYGRPED
jgi:fatty-acyl-CoA synthase